MKGNAKTLTDRLREYATICLEAADELEKAYADIAENTYSNASNTSQSNIEPKRELFEYYVSDSLFGGRFAGVIEAKDLSEAQSIFDNYIKPSSYCVSHIKKLEFNSKGFCDVYVGF